MTPNIAAPKPSVGLLPHWPRRGRSLLGVHAQAVTNRLQKRGEHYITADPGGHRQRHPCLPGRTSAEPDLTQAAAPGRRCNRTAPGTPEHHGRIGGGTAQGSMHRVKLASAEAGGGWRAHTALDTASRKAATGPMVLGQALQLKLDATRGIHAKGGSRVSEGCDMPVAATTGTQSQGKAASSTGLGCAEAAHAWKRSNFRRSNATELPKPERKVKKEPNRSESRQTYAGIGHSAPMHRGGHVQNSIRCRRARRGKTRIGPQSEQP